MIPLSVVIPVLNEASQLPETVRHARAVPEVREIIVVDGGSADRTVAIAGQLGCRCLAAPASRGGQLRIGAGKACGEVVILLHADTWLPEEAGRAIMDCLEDPVVVGGGFWKMFRERHLINAGSRWRSPLLFFLGGPILGDQAIFVRRAALEKIGGVPDMALMEEFELCRRLRRVGRLKLARATVSTSMRRFAKHGVVRTYLRMGWTMLNYFLGVPPEALLRQYERRKGAAERVQRQL